jgi:hypothetical protein
MQGSRALYLVTYVKDHHLHMKWICRFVHGRKTADSTETAVGKASNIFSKTVDHLRLQPFLTTDI